MENGIVIAEDVAIEIVKGYETEFDLELDEGTLARLVRMTTRGRLDRGDDGSFIITLRCPIDLKNGETVEKLVMRQPCVDEIRQAAKKGGGDFEVGIRLLSIMAGLPFGVIGQLKQRDFIDAGTILAFFA